jgi:uncharacterized cupin superfamily protein
VSEEDQITGLDKGNMTGNGKSIIRLNPDPAGFGASPDTLKTEDFSSDVPVQHTHSVFEDDEIGLYVGLWDTASMVEAGGPYACDEFMWLIEGECQIRNNRTGEIASVKAGAPFLIPKGYDCQWHQSGYLRKFFVISEHPGEEIPAVPAHEGIVILKADAVLKEAVDGAPFEVTTGTRPQHKVCYEDTTGRFFAGIWASDAFESRQRPFPYNEFAYVQDGSITLSDAEGATQIFNTGDAFFIPEGVECAATVAISVRLYIAVIKSD